ARRGRDHLAQRFGQDGGPDPDPAPGHLGQAGEVLRGQDPEREVGPAALDAGPVFADVDRHRPWLEGADDVAEQPGRHHRRPFVIDLGRGRHPDRELEIGAGQLDLVGPRPDQETRQDRERTRPGGHRSPGVADGLAQGITLAAELHSPSLAVFSSLLVFLSWVVVVGLWIVHNQPSRPVAAEFFAPRPSTEWHPGATVTPSPPPATRRNPDVVPRCPQTSPQGVTAPSARLMPTLPT